VPHEVAALVLCEQRRPTQCRHHVDFAQDALVDVVFVELPTVGATLSQGQTFGVVESNKTVSDLFRSGERTE